MFNLFFHRSLARFKQSVFHSELVTSTLQLHLYFHTHSHAHSDVSLIFFFGVISISTCHTVPALACEVFPLVESRLDNLLDSLFRRRCWKLIKRNYFACGLQWAGKSFLEPCSTLSLSLFCFFFFLPVIIYAIRRSLWQANKFPATPCGHVVSKAKRRLATRFKIQDASIRYRY